MRIDSVFHARYAGALPIKLFPSPSVTFFTEKEKHFKLGGMAARTFASHTQYLTSIPGTHGRKPGWGPETEQRAQGAAARSRPESALQLAHGGWSELFAKSCLSDLPVLVMAPKQTEHTHTHMVENIKDSYSGLCLSFQHSDSKMGDGDKAGSSHM